VCRPQMFDPQVFDPQVFDPQMFDPQMFDPSRALAAGPVASRSCSC